MAEVWRIPRGTVYWLANKHRWRRYKLGRQVYYHAADILASLD
ncbi:helix-turn-helix domain-containing protein [Saccharothrix syringae]|nr:helix-turn-helix domain-containing protein [Saccharothrix syringae]